MPTERELPETHCQVSFHVRDQRALDALMVRAREIDMKDEMGAGINPADVPESYTVPQALQVVFHCDPTWLYENYILDSWTIDAAKDENGRYQNIWGGAPNRPVPDMANQTAVEQWLDE